MSKRTIAIIIGIIALIVVGTNAYGWVSAHRSMLLLTRDRSQPPATAVFVAKRAPAAISLLANIDDLVSLNRLAIPSSQHRAASQVIKKWKQQLGDRLHLDYQREIAPWLGDEMTFAITDLNFISPRGSSLIDNRRPQNTPQPGYLAVLSSRNPQVSSQKIQAWWDKQVEARRLEFESYQGVKIGYNDRHQLASAIVGDRYILFANHPKVLREAINNLQVSNLSILENPDYQQVLAANNHHKIGVGYARLPDLKGWLGKEAGEKYPVVGLNLGVDRQGLIADMSLYPAPIATSIDPTPISAPPKLVSTLKYLPRQSTMAIAGTDLSHWQQQLIDILPELKPLTTVLDSSIASIGKQIGIDLTQDIFNWTTGEYALAAIPNPDRNITDWVFIAERTQPERVDKSIAHFDELAGLAGYNVGLLPWNDKQAIGWTKLVTETTTNTTQLVAQVSGVHTTIADKYTILASSVEAMDITLKAIDKQSILDSPRYHNAANLLAATDTGYLYGNWQTISDLLPKQLRENSLVKSVSDGIFSGLPNISVNSYTEAGIQRVSLLFQVE
ncbi:DUF3352 domain-containing protein [Chamaesiphon sp. VAR_48_metabat_135_sub]|uniref:DUF3352 domain-containing protein n=1 Tax=Chamaesiphon sp. VAR_48_metabat_135_sub TaxID=2964699 RepID=UPI00286CE9DE|nr:DUF3352 domain-containing protein [Chamaesiphon sp. VAR_48_metabat_135_sub]